MITTLESQLMEFIDSDEMTETFYKHFESLSNDGDNSAQLLFFCEVKALRLWAALSTANLYIKNRDEFIKLMDFVEQNLSNKTHPEILNFMFNRHISYLNLGPAATSYTKVGYEFVKNTKLITLKEEAVNMVKAFLGRTAGIYKEFY